MSHTPGPWKVVPSNQVKHASAEFYIWAAHGDQRSPSVAHVKHSTKRPTLANARLIAAAPRLLSALEALVFRWEGTPANQTPREVKDARDAIASAKGEA